MYWDVVEVKPEPGYRLFVRFRDGRAGRVQLQREELTGALAPLLDEQFFERVFLDCGVVAWPGEIDLAPDAMYAQVASEPVGVGGATLRSQLPRFYELKDLLVDPSHPDAYFQSFENLLRDESCFDTFARWEKELQGLDTDAWQCLKGKASPYLKRKDNCRGWQQLFDALGEASAYNYLRRSEGCSKVWFVPESDGRTPDLEGVRDGVRVLCEVKTINISDDEVRARRGPPAVRKVSDRLMEGFFRKLDSDISIAKGQLQSYDPGSDARHLLYINICFDDWLGFYGEDYLGQISQHLLATPPNIEVVVKTGSPKATTCVVAR
jgi:hypothetical protein